MRSVMWPCGCNIYCPYECNDMYNLVFHLVINFDRAKDSGSENGRGPENVSVHGFKEVPIVFQLELKLRFGSAP